jgi:hypothetical protein
VIRAIIISLLLATPALAETETITLNGQDYSVTYGIPDRRGVSLDHITVGNLQYDACERRTPAGYVEVDCVTGREPD